MNALQDVIVLGGGPAGAATAARLAITGIRVALVERPGPASVRIGESLPPAAWARVVALGAAARFLSDRHLETPGTVACWETETPAAHDYLYTPPGRGWHLDRRRFDRMLRKTAVAAGARVIRARPLDIESRSNGFWTLRVRGRDGAMERVSGRLVVDATGRSSWFARRQGMRRSRLDRLVALAGLVPTPATADPRLLVEAAPWGWSYCVPQPSGGLAAVCLMDADDPWRGSTLASTWRSRIGSTPHVAARAGELAPTCVRLLSAATERLMQFAGHGWLAVGDAAFSRDPLSSGGIAGALEMASLAAESIGSWFQGSCRAAAEYASALEDQWSRYLAEQRVQYGAVDRWPTELFWLRRRGAMTSRSPAPASDRR
ncbi:MAG: tryptophan 7-halogenase [Planctomyces sp.]|nr:tryptophan 7-halogenase [Planctomyces sp.]